MEEAAFGLAIALITQIRKTGTGVRKYLAIIELPPFSHTDAQPTATKSLLLLVIKDKVYFKLWVCVCEYVHLSAGTMETRGGRQVSWSWSYRQL